MKTFRNQNQPIPVNLLLEKQSGESETIPDQAMSVREILHRYTSGQTLDVNNHTPVYLEDVPLYDVRRKNNIDLAVDRLEHEKNLHKMAKKIGDDKTSLEQLDRDINQMEVNLSQKKTTKSQEANE